MNSLLLAIAIALSVRSLASSRLERWNLGAPLVMVLAGVTVGLLNSNSIALALNTEDVQHAAEFILAVLLFVDATEIREGRLWGRSPGLVARVLFLAMPASLALAMLAGWALFPALSWPVLLLAACVVVPIDFAPAERLIRDRSLPTRVRGVLNMESGYNDGIISPLFLFALVLTGGEDKYTPLQALATAIPFVVKAIIVGVVLGTVLAWSIDRAEEAGWVTGQSRRIIVLMTPLLTYTITVGINGNGFVAAFACGVLFRHVHRLTAAHRLRRSLRTRTSAAGAAAGDDFQLLEDVTSLMTMTMWFTMGVTAVFSFSLGIPWQVLLFCLAALTVIRVLPVQLSLTGSVLSPRERLLVGLLGPRGTTTIVFGLIAFNRLPEGPAADTLLFMTVTCVLGSVIMHGMSAAPMIQLVNAPPQTASHRR